MLMSIKKLYIIKTQNQNEVYDTSVIGEVYILLALTQLLYRIILITSCGLVMGIKSIFHSDFETDFIKNEI